MNWIGRCTHRNEYDAVLWLYDQGKTAELLCDDLAVHVNTVQRMKDEPQEEYTGFNSQNGKKERKLPVAKEWANQDLRRCVR